MASVYPAPVSAAQVGSYFVQQYYQMVQQQPDFVYQFYTDASTMLRIDGDTHESATAMLQIHSLIMSLNFTGIEIQTVNSLDSWNRGVIVMVTGLVQTKDYSGKTKFAQTFFLAPQEKGYFVLNDIFQFLEEKEIPQHQAPILAHSQFDSSTNVTSPLPEPVPDYIPVEESQAREFVASAPIEESDSVDKYSVPEKQELQHVPESNGVTEETHVEEPTVLPTPAVNTVQDNTVQDPSPVIVEEPVEPQKHTYASILRVAKGQSTPAVAPQRSTNKINTPSSDWHRAPTSSQNSLPATSLGSESYTADVTEDRTSHYEEGEGRSVYVRNLSSTISVSDIEQEFKKFGILKPDGVVLRDRKDIGVYYAFVEFEDAVGAQKAIEASPIQLDGRQIHVEERRANSSSISRGRGRGRGRGGYPMDSSRGRFSGRNFSRGSGDGFEREFNRPRGNGAYRRPPTQERGILGSHGSRNGPNLFDGSA